MGLSGKGASHEQTPVCASTIGSNLDGDSAGSRSRSGCCPRHLVGDSGRRARDYGRGDLARWRAESGESAGGVPVDANTYMGATDRASLLLRGRGGERDLVG